MKAKCKYYLIYISRNAIYVYILICNKTLSQMGLAVRRLLHLLVGLSLAHPLKVMAEVSRVTRPDRHLPLRIRWITFASQL